MALAPDGVVVPIGARRPVLGPAPGAIIRRFLLSQTSVEAEPDFCISRVLAAGTKANEEDECSPAACQGATKRRRECGDCVDKRGCIRAGAMNGATEVAFELPASSSLGAVAKWPSPAPPPPRYGGAFDSRRSLSKHNQKPVDGCVEDGKAAHGGPAHGRGKGKDKEQQQEEEQEEDAAARGRFAFVTTVFGRDPAYYLEACVMGASLKAKTEADMILLHTEDVPGGWRKMFVIVGWTLKCVEHIKYSKRLYQRGRFRHAFTKLRAMELHQYSRVVLLDTDMLIRHCPDEVFLRKAPSAVRRHPTGKVPRPPRDARKDVVPGWKPDRWYQRGLCVAQAFPERC